MSRRFDDEPDSDDVLQLAGDVALNAIRAYLEHEGLDGDSYSVVITLEHGDALATCLHLPGDAPERLKVQRAFDTQLLHLAATASELGVRVHVVPMPRGHG